jgi:hypothetical protein
LHLVYKGFFFNPKIQNLNLIRYRCHDIAEILQKLALNTNQSINHKIWTVLPSKLESLLVRLADSGGVSYGGNSSLLGVVQRIVGGVDSTCKLYPVFRDSFICKTKVDF